MALEEPFFSVDSLVSIRDLKTRNSIFKKLKKLQANDPCLKVLEINNISLQDSGIQLLAEALKNNTSLKHLYIQQVGITGVGLQALASRLSDNPTLEVVEISTETPCDEESMKLFIVALEKYQHLHLKVAPISPEYLTQETMQLYSRLVRQRSTRKSVIRRATVSDITPKKKERAVFRSPKATKRESSPRDRRTRLELEDHPQVHIFRERGGHNSSTSQPVISKLPNEDGHEGKKQKNSRNVMHHLSKKFAGRSPEQRNFARISNATAALCAVYDEFLDALNPAQQDAFIEKKGGSERLVSIKYTVSRLVDYLSDGQKIPTGGLALIRKFVLAVDVSPPATTLQSVPSLPNPKAKRNHPPRILSASSFESATKDLFSEENRPDEKGEERKEEKAPKENRDKKSPSKERTPKKKKVRSQTPEIKSGEFSLGERGKEKERKEKKRKEKEKKEKIKEKGEEKEKEGDEDCRFKDAPRYKTIDFLHAKITKTLAPLGGSGACVFACDVDGMQCALKEFRFDKRPDESTLAKFCSEIELLESLEHPNIVKYLFHSRKRKAICLFLTRYESSLRKEIQHRRAGVRSESGEFFQCREILDMIFGLVKGLRYLHSHKVIHRDLKSDNIFLNYGERGNIIETVIGDFDSAKRLVVTPHAKTIIGTTNYMAPEMMCFVLGNTPPEDFKYTIKADIWSFGMVLYEILTLELPYGHLKLQEAAQLISQGTPPPIPVTAGAFPPPETIDQYKPILELIELCSIADPELRPTAVELHDEIKKRLFF